MKTRFSEENVLRKVRRIRVLASVAGLALVCAGPTRAQSKPAQTDAAAAPSAPAVPGNPPGVQSSSASPANASALAQSSAPKTTQPVAQNSSAKPPASKGTSEGIGVHGHWVIEVHNPDGKLVSHTEFENSLQPAGMTDLAQILGQNSSIGPWFIEFTTIPGPCTSGPNLIFRAAGLCAIVQGPGVGQGTVCLTGGACIASGMPAPTVSTSPPNQSVISGSFTFPASGTGGTIISAVTGTYLCASSESPQMCASTTNLVNALPSALSFFSSAPVLPNVVVGPGQIVTVTVTFSFS
jgi:hypothetical protein